MNVIYARQSVDKRDSLSIDGQIELCRKFAGDDAVVYQDRGYSGKNTKRPAFMELIKEVESGTVQKIYVYRLDRFSRSIADFSRLWELLQEHGVEFYSVTEQFDTSSPIGRAMLNIVLVFAQLERETIAARVKDNYFHRFSLGAWPGGPAPYGYDLTKIIDNGRNVSSLVPNDKAETVREIFALYAKPETSLRNIGKKLNERGIAGPKRKLWDSVTISRILHSPVYVKADKDVYLHFLTQGQEIETDIAAFDGVHACNLIGRRDRAKNKRNTAKEQTLAVCNHEGIIDSTLWIKVQEKLSANKQLPKKNAGKYSWLTGLLKCADCGYALKINHSQKENKNYLLCSGRSNFASCSNAIKVDITELEAYVENCITEMLEASPPTEMLTENSNVASKLLEIETKIERLVNALSEVSDVSAAYISKQIDALHKERESLMTDSKKCQVAIGAIDFKALNFDDKKLVAAQFVDKILISGNEVNIVWKV